MTTKELGTRAFATPPSMLQLRPEVSLVLADRDVVHDGSAKWSPAWGIRAATHKTLSRSAIVEINDQLQASTAPAPWLWIVDRLTTLTTTFTLGRAPADPRQLAIWLSETARLLDDLPHDILAHSIDTAIRFSRHGFMPSIGEIRAIADPLASARFVHIERLGELLAADWPAEDAMAAPR